MSRIIQALEIAGNDIRLYHETAIKSHPNPIALAKAFKIAGNDILLYHASAIGRHHDPITLAQAFKIVGNNILLYHASEIANHHDPIACANEKKHIRNRTHHLSPAFFTSARTSAVTSVPEARVIDENSIVVGTVVPSCQAKFN